MLIPWRVGIFDKTLLRILLTNQFVSLLCGYDFAKMYRKHPWHSPQVLSIGAHHRFFEFAGDPNMGIVLSTVQAM